MVDLWFYEIIEEGDGCQYIVASCVKRPLLEKFVERYDPKGKLTDANGESWVLRFLMKDILARPSAVRRVEIKSKKYQYSE